ncbi:MAG: SBBP repeat-containing protein [Flavobacteriales bacterium]|nr:SBBP repeat-containing protein [Flavobacteriales bacterium]
MRIVLLLLLSLLLQPITLNAQEWNWAVDAGGGGNTDFCWGIATDSQGNAYWAGSIGSTADFGCTTLSPSAIAGVLAKYDSTGACLWARGITVGFNDAWAYGIVIDTQDRIYVTGSYDGNADFGNGITLNSLGGDDIFLARYDVDGNCLWARRAGSSGSNDEARGIAVSDSGDVFITGISGGTTIAFDNISIPNPANFRQIIIARYDSTGMVQWAKASTGNGQGKSSRAITVANDRLYVTGQIASAGASFDGLEISPTASTKLYVLACDLIGNALWANAYGVGDHEGMGVSADTLGNVFVSARMWGALYLPDDTLNSVSANNDILLMGLDTAGTFRWAMSTGSSQNDVAYDVEADGLGNAYVSAQFLQTIDFFGTPLTALGSEDLLVARITNWGAVSWVKQGGGFMRDVGLCVHRSNVGSKPVYMGGYYFGPATYGGSTIDDVLNGDAMMAQLSDTTIVDIVTALPLRAHDRDALLFPSPAADHITLHTTRPIVQLSVVSMLGGVMPIRYDGTTEIDVSTLAPGLYFLRAVLNDGSVIGGGVREGVTTDLG